MRRRRRRWPVWLLLLRIRLLYGWRRSLLSWHLPLEAEPDARAELPPIDTGGAYRPAFGSQFGDPSESHTSPHSEGSNCTMAAAGMALDYQTAGERRRGGDMRHRQSDSEGGTDLYDAAEAFASYGESLSVRSGRGWASAAADLAAGRGIILQGTGGLAGCGDYTGGHAVYVNPERSGSRWLKGDPECSGWEWCEERTLQLWAEELSPSVMYAATAAQEGGGSEVVTAVKLTMTGPLDAEATVVGNGHSWIRIWDSHWGAAAAGFTKRVYARAELAEPIVSPGGSTLPAGLPVVLIGDDAAFFLEQDVELVVAPSPSPPPSVEYAQGRADEWQTWASALGIPPEPEG